MEYCSEILLASLDILWAQFASPDSRLFLGYWCTSFLLATWVYFRTRSTGSFLAFLAPKKSWYGPSFRLDIKLILFNSLFKVYLGGQFVYFSLALASGTKEGLEWVLGPLSPGLGPTQTLISYTLALLFLNDFAAYWLHRAMHEVPFLWRIHRIHHTATTLTPLTLLRVHPLELLLNHSRSIGVAGLTAGFFDYCSTSPLSLATFLGVSIGNFLFFAWGSNLRHSHIPLSYWNWLERIFISPHQHQIHHSVLPEHHHRNFGSKFALWDWAMGTLTMTEETRDLRFGVAMSEGKQPTLLAALGTPFTRARSSNAATQRSQEIVPTSGSEFPTSSLPLAPSER